MIIWRIRSIIIRSVLCFNSMNLLLETTAVTTFSDVLAATVAFLELTRKSPEWPVVC